MEMLIWAIVIAVLLAVLFLIVPAIALVLYLSTHKSPVDFDQDPDVMDGTPYEEHKTLILQRLNRLRSISYKEIKLKADDGTALCAQWYPQGKKTAILLHGFRSTPMNNFFEVANVFLDEGWSVLMPYMRGHGKSGGRTTLGIKEADDICMWAKWVSEQPDCTDIVLYGMSMGGAAINFASDRDWPEQVRALFVDAAFYDVQRQIKGLKQFRFVPKKIFFPIFMAFYRWILHVNLIDGLDRLAHAAKPMGFIEGSEDKTVAPMTVKTSYQACGSPKILLKAEGAAHTLSFLIGGNSLKESLFSFINEHTKQTEVPL